MNNVIVFKNDNGGVSVCIPTGELPIEEVLAKDVPQGRDARIVDSAELPEKHNLFFNAWEMDSQSVYVNMDKAKAIGHDMRREERAKEFAPLDIQATIPAKAEEAEAARQVIRDKYAVIQQEIDAATTPEEIKVALGLAEPVVIEPMAEQPVIGE